MKTNKMLTSYFLLPFALIVVWQIGFAQEPNPTSNAPNPAPTLTVEPVNQPDHIPLYRVRVVERNLDAVNYFHRSGSTKIGLRGTDLLPMVHGEARVKSESGRVVIDAAVDGLGSPSAFGPEYITYVLWAITPDGRPQNLVLLCYKLGTLS